MTKPLLIVLALLALAGASQADVALFATNATWRYVKGTNEASSPDSAAWRSRTFDDSGWLTGNGAFWYDTDTNPQTAYSGSTQLSDMQGRYTCVFLRKTFVITNLSDVQGMTLTAFCDDGFIAWINGTEVARYNISSGPVAYTNTSLAALGEPLPTISYPTPNPSSFLALGTNVIGIQAFNSSLAGSSDFVISTVLSYQSPDLVPPTLVSKAPGPGTVGNLGQITLQFSEPVTGVNASDLLINNSPASGLSGGGDTYTFTFPQPPQGAVQVRFASFPGIVDLANPPNEFDTAAPEASWSYTLFDGIAPTVTGTVPTTGTTVGSLLQIEVFFSESVTNVEASDLLINGVPASTLDQVGPGQYVFAFPQPATGQVQVAWAVDHGIKDLALNSFAGGSWTYTRDPNAGQTVVLINEFMADNKSTLRDQDGDRSDWIELYNNGSQPVNLLGWYLTDSAANLRRWQFPAVTMPTNTYLVVFASGKNRADPTNQLHTSFQLSARGEYLALVYPDGTTIASEFSPIFPEQRQDVSYGRDPVQTDLTGFFSTPSPGSRNIPGGPDFAPDIVFSQNSGAFVNPFSLSLSLARAASNTVIRYLVFTNASGLNQTNVPGTNSPIYSSPIAVSTTTHVRARAFQTGFLPGSPRSESYIALNPNALSFTSSLPIIILHNSGAGTVPSTSDQFVMMQEFDPKNGFASLTNAPDVASRGIFHLRGSSTLNIAKSSFLFEAQDEFGSDKNISLGGLPEDSDWVLYAPNNFEPVLVHNPTAYELSRQAGRYASRTRFVTVLFSSAGGAISLPTPSSGNYNGIYVLEEKVKIGKSRVDVDKLEPENLSVPSVTGGYLLSIDRIPPGEVQLNAGGQSMNFVDPHYQELTTPQRLPQRAYISNYFASFGTALNSATYTNPVTGYQPYIDTDAWVEHSILDVVAFNVDGLRLSGYFHKPRNGRITMGPVWDFDRTQGSTDGRDFNPRTFRSTTGDFGTDFFNPQNSSPTVAWWGRLFTDPNFFQRWVDRYQELRAGCLSTTNVQAIIETFATQVRAEQPREQARWAYNPRSGTVSSGGFSYTFAGGYNGEVTWMKVWYSNRLDFIDTNFLARPRFSNNGGMISPGFQVALTPAAEVGSSVYYTLDGSDPRALHGAISPSALLYAGPITLTNNTRVTARSYNPSHRNLTGPNNPPISVPWSGAVADTWVVHTPDLIVTELMFNPGPVSLNDTNDVDNFEYIELRNIATNSMNLVGFKFTNGVDFGFTASSGVTNLAPGGYVLIVKNLPAFTSRYGAHTNVAGEFTGSLDNSGERITLVGPALEAVLDFVYNDTWFDLSDGGGFSIVAQDESTISTNLNNRTGWRLSSYENGSAGVSNPPALDLQRVYVNEALTHEAPLGNDAIELFNPNTNTVDISGWFLTDDFKNPKKFQIPVGTTLASGGFVVFDETQFNTGPNAFGLKSEGDQIYLFFATNGVLTGGYHGFDVGGAQTGVAFGRYVNSQGNEDFVAQATNTLSGTNSLPLVGPVVISEIMYHPPDTLAGTNVLDNPVDEYIELLNITATNVVLFEPAFSSNTWRLSKAVSFSFPTNVILSPAARLLVVGFDPSSNSLQAAFRSRYAVPVEVPIFGPYFGKLGNTNENLHLSRPDTAFGTNVAFVLVDRVEYRNTAPWPFPADGYGASLHRFTETAYGNDPINWYAARPTPGTASQGGEPPQIQQQPQDVTALEGASTNLSIQVSSLTTVVYQWSFNSHPLQNQTNSTLALPSLQPAQAGSYSVVAFNGGGAVFSASAVVTVRSLPSILQQPQSQNVKPGTNFTISVTATGTGTLHYQWRMNGVNILGATGPSISYTNAQLDPHAGYYDVVVTDDVGTRISQPATLLVLVLPTILVQPVSQVVATGQTARFTILAVPDHPMLPLNIRWLRNSSVYVSNAPSTLVLLNARTNATFRPVLTNLAGTVPGALVSLTVLPDTDQDGIPDAYEIANGLSSTDPADASADPDGDGMTNLQEYIAGTDRTNALSYLKLEPVQFLDPSNTLLQFLAVSNRYYSLDYANSLDTNSWTNLLSLPPSATNRLFRTTNSLTTPTRFYRLGIPPLN